MESNLTAGLPPVVNEANPQITLGSIYVSPDGLRAWRYVKAGALALVAGNMLQGAAETTTHQNLAVAAAAVGDKTVTTTTTVTVTANQYAGGTLVVSVTPGLGYIYKIRSHPAATAAVVTLSLESPIIVALTTASRVDLRENPFANVILCPTTLTGQVVGVAAAPISIGQFGWAQVRGAAPVLNDAAGAITVGAAVMPSTSVGGAVRLATAGFPVVGQAVTGITSGETGTVNLNIS